MDIINDLVLANHILARRNIVDAFGHVSVRHPERPDCFLLARSKAPSLVQREDIHVFGLDGELVEPAGIRPYVERYIHSEVYRQRPDVMAITHSHSPAVIPFGVTAAALRPICHMSAFLRGSVPVFDTHDHCGDTDLLVRTPEMGRALATQLGNGAAALMRGHGSITVGGSLAEAVFRAIYLEANAKLQSEAMRLGRIRFLSDGEAELCDLSGRQHIGRAWEMWVKELDADPS